MIYNDNYVPLEEDFLQALSEQSDREIYAKLAALDIDENPVETIEGRVTGGSINIDGQSSVRRTCSFTMVSKDVNINEFYWGIRTKFRLEIGLKNKLIGKYAVSDIYPEIVWFPQGTFVISGFNTSLSTNNCVISVSGKDKISLLNGELGGQLFASIDFGTEEIENKNMIEVLSGTTIKSSDALATYQYYVVPEEGDYPSKWYINKDDKFVFIKHIGTPETYTHIYYKNGNCYSQASENESYEVLYDCYKRADEPQDFFIPASNVSAEEEKNFYRQKLYNTDTEQNKETGYFVLNDPPEQNVSLYALKPYYTLEYEYTKYQIPIYKIIREAVHTYAKEPYHNIIINDLEDYGLEQLTYRGEKPLYVLRNCESGDFTQLFLEDNIKNDTNGLYSLITKSNNFEFDNFSAEFNSSITSFTKVYVDDNKEFSSTGDESRAYTVGKIEYGDDVGYRLTELVYPGELVSNIGESLTSILDKIKTMLGDFEYFYDIEGRFIFQRKHSYVNTSWSQLFDSEDEVYVDFANSERSKFSYSFEGNKLFSAIQNSPVLTNLRNDFTVWGKRKSLSGAEIPIHARYAIDKKPVQYVALNGKVYTTSKDFYNDDSFQYYKNLLINYEPSYMDSIPVNLRPQRGADRMTWSCGWWREEDWLAYLLILGQHQGYMSSDARDGQSLTNFLQMGGFSRSIYSGPASNLRRVTITRTNGVITAIRGASRDTSQEVWIYGPMVTKRSTDDKYYYTEADIRDYVKNHQENVQEVDWREIIYQMALDYFAGQGCSVKNPVHIFTYVNGTKTKTGELTDPDHFLYEVGHRNPTYYPTGYTGYEQYYTDLQGFWRQLYNPDYVPSVVYEPGSYQNNVIKNSGSIYFKYVKEWSDMKISDINFEYYVDKNETAIADFWNTYYNKINDDHLKNLINRYTINDEEDEPENLKERKYWNISVFESPETLNFWFDFLDSDYELGQFSVEAVGDRSKVVNEDKASSIIFKEIPGLILYEHNADLEELKNKVEIRTAIQKQSGYVFIYLPKGFSKYFSTSYRSLSVKNKIDELLYQYSYCIENINLTSVPIYQLEPNTRIFVQDKSTGIEGEYLVSRITIPLNYNSMMSVSATKAPERLY